MIKFNVLIDVFFDVDSKSTIGFQLSRVVFELWTVKLTRIFFICKRMRKIKLLLTELNITVPNQTLPNQI